MLSNSQAGPGRKVKQEQEEISRNHVPRLFLGSVYMKFKWETKLRDSRKARASHETYNISFLISVWENTLTSFWRAASSFSSPSRIRRPDGKMIDLVSPSRLHLPSPVGREEKRRGKQTVIQQEENPSIEPAAEATELLRNF